MIRSRLPRMMIAATLALFCVTAVVPASAGELSGRLYFGPRTQLHLQEDEGIFTQFLRTIRLVSKKATVRNINAIAIQNDYLFIGSDQELYLYERTNQEVFHVGSATDLSNLELKDGVRLMAVEDLGSHFESGESSVGLQVVMDKPMDKVDGVKRARFADWLELMVNTYDETTMTELDEGNYYIILNALTTALPDGDNEDPRAFEHLKILKSFIEANEFDSPTALQNLVDRMLEIVEENSQNPDFEQAANDVLPAFKKLDELLLMSY